MHIVVYGTGGVGGYFGIRLAQAGNKVTFIARGTHLKVMKEKGLRLKSYKGDAQLYPVNATDDISKITSPIDMVLVAVKAWQLAEVAKDIKQVLSGDTMVLPLLNGVTNHEVLCEVLPQENVLGGLCKIVSKIEEPGVIHHMSYEPMIIFGELNNKDTKRGRLLLEVLRKAGIKAYFSKNIIVDIWKKYLYITTVSAIGALTRSTIGEMLKVPQVKKMMRDTAEEIVSVAKAKGVKLPNDVIEKQFEIIENQPYDTTSSMQRDMMNSKPSELEAQNGTIVKLGQKLGVPTPVTHFIYYTLLPQEQRHRGG